MFGRTVPTSYPKGESWTKAPTSLAPVAVIPASTNTDETHTQGIRNTDANAVSTNSSPDTGANENIPH